MDNLLEMIFIDKYILKFYDESNYDFNTLNNKFNYQKSYIPHDNYSLNTIYGIQLYDENGTLFSDCIIGASNGKNTIGEHSTIINSDNLVICCSNYVFKLSIPELNLIWKTEADQATCFGVYELEDDYITHGELEITKISKDGKIQWKQSGRDIWTTPEGVDDFKIQNNFIYARDWDYNQYQFDFNGNLIHEIKNNK